MGQQILIVDDCSTMRHALRVILRDAGHDVIEADDGHAALGLLDGRPIDLIISDLNMPHMDGLNFSRAVKALPAYAQTHLLMLSTEVSPEKKAEGKAAGITGWLSKPFDARKLLLVIEKLFPAQGA